MEKIDQNTFFTITKHFDVIPYSQTESWVMAQSDNDPLKLLFLVDNTHNPKIGCVAHIKKKCGLKMLLIEAERRENKNFKSSTIRCFYEELRQLGFDAIEINSCLPYSSEYEIGIRQAGFLRPVGLFSVQFSNYIDLSNEISFNENWRRNLKKASANNLSFEVIDEAQKKDIEDFLNLYGEMKEQKNLSQPFSASSIETLLSGENFQLFFVKNTEEERVSTIIIHKSREHAGLLYAATSEKAHICSAGFFMYEKVIQFLKKENFSTFDMEKLAPFTHSTNSVFLFKNGIKGSHIVVNGEWGWYKKQWIRPMMFFVKKYLQHRIEI